MLRLTADATLIRAAETVRTQAPDADQEQALRQARTAALALVFAIDKNLQQSDLGEG